MLKTKILLAISCLLLATLACNALSPATPTVNASPTSPEPTSTMIVIVEPTFPPTKSNLPATEADVPRVTIEETMAAWAAGAATIVDVRAPSAYDISHIQGAMNIPLGAIESDPTNLNLDKEQWIITYCT